MEQQGERRRQTLSAGDITALLRAFEAAHCIPTAEHKTHHDFVRRLIEQDRKRAERWEKIKAQVGGWAIVTGLGAIGTGVWHGFVYIRDHLR